VTSDALDSAIPGLCDAAKSGLCTDAAKFELCAVVDWEVVDIEPVPEPNVESTSDDPPSKSPADSAPNGAEDGGPVNPCWRFSRKEDFIIESSNMESVGCPGCRAR
jgi:hypothetical protein